MSIANELTPQLAAIGVPSTSVPAFVAQIDNETASGTSRNATARNNFAGIRGATVTPQNRLGYQTYATREAGIAAYISLISRRYQGVVTAGATGDPFVTAVAMGNSPWAGTRYRLGARGDEDAIADRGGVVGRVGTEGQALFPTIRRTIELTTPVPTAPGQTVTPAPARPATPPRPGAH